MKASFAIALIPGGFECAIDFLPLEHLLHSRFKMRAVGAAYIFEDSMLHGERWHKFDF